jgi:hypothetical protein
MKTDFRPRALKVRRDDFNPPIAVFEPPDPTKKPMYPKQLVSSSENTLALDCQNWVIDDHFLSLQVYVGGRDVQLEEIRAAHYWKDLDQISYDDDNVAVPKPETKVVLTRRF